MKEARSAGGVGAVELGDPGNVLVRQDRPAVRACLLGGERLPQRRTRPPPASATGRRCCTRKSPATRPAAARSRTPRTVTRILRNLPRRRDLELVRGQRYPLVQVSGVGSSSRRAYAVPTGPVNAARRRAPHGRSTTPPRPFISNHSRNALPPRTSSSLHIERHPILAPRQAAQLTLPRRRRPPGPRPTGTRHSRTGCPGRGTSFLVWLVVWLVNFPLGRGRS